MLKRNGLRGISIVLLSIVAGSSGAGAQDYEPYDPNGYRLYTYFYYTDETFTEAAGSKIERCYEPATVSGVETPYYNRYNTGYYSYTQGCTEY